MASKRKINQGDLRKMMAQVKTGSGGVQGGATVSKRYKLSSRELALMEEQKRQQEDRKRLKEAQNKAALAKLPPAPLPGARPQKSILKNTCAYQPPIMIPSNITLSQSKPQSEHSDSPTEDILKSEKETASPFVHNSASSSKTDPNSTSLNSMEEKQAPTTRKLEDKSPIKYENQHPMTENSDLPEGFFDDPVQDAKARNVPYINVEEEEWEKFQKEINEEMSTAQTILVEDREEATADRQIEEIDEQMEAWRRVSKMEQKKDLVHLKRTSTQENNPTRSNIESDDADSIDEDEDFEEFLSWRKKR